MKLTYNELKKLKKGDKIEEVDMQQSFISIISKEPKETFSNELGNQLEWEAKTEDGRIIPYMITEELMHYSGEFYLYN